MTAPRGRFTVVGCGTVVPEPDRSCSAYLLEAAGTRLLLDCGPGTVRALARVGARWPDITDIWVSHFHTDHIGDLPGLLFALTWGLLPETRKAPLTIWGPTGTRKRLEAFARATGSHVLEPGFEVTVRELEPGHDGPMGTDLEIRVISTPHTEESLAARFSGPGVSVAYSGDTGPAVRLGEFAAGVDLFVCECSLPDDLVGDNHLSPRHVADFACRAAADTVLVTHVYPQFRAAADVAGLVRAAGYSGHVELAREGWSRSLRGE